MNLKIGDSLPDVSLLDQNKKLIDLNKLTGKNTVIYFYPKDFTPGCTREACSFRDNYSLVEKYGAIVIGISNDSPESHTKFAKRYQLSYTLLSDKSKMAEKAFGVQRNLFGLLPGRETFVFNKEGKLVGKFSSAIAATKHVDEALKLLKGINN